METNKKSENSSLYTEHFLSQLMICAFNFPPKGYALCNGQLLPINQNQALFALLGTTYGGNGQTNFALPNLRGRSPMHMGMGHTLGEAAGSTSVTVNLQQLPTHIHAPYDNPSDPTPNTASLEAGGPANSTDPENNFFASEPGSVDRFRDVYDDQIGNSGAVSSNAVGGSQPHNNMMPYTVLNFVIALQGVFPSPNN